MTNPKIFNARHCVMVEVPRAYSIAVEGFPGLFMHRPLKKYQDKPDVFIEIGWVVSEKTTGHQVAEVPGGTREDMKAKAIEVLKNFGPDKFREGIRRSLETLKERGIEI